MPLHGVDSRVHFQGSREELEQGDSGKEQRERTDTSFNGGPRSPLFSNMVMETLFQKKRVPSTDELGGALRSNLGSSLAADNAYLEQQCVQYSSPSFTWQPTTQLQEEDNDPPASLLELAPLVYATQDHTEPAGGISVVNEAKCAKQGASAPLLSTTVLYAPYTDSREKEVQVPSSSPTPTRYTQKPFRGHVGATECIQLAIEDDVDDTAWLRSLTDPVLVQNHQSTFSNNEVANPADQYHYHITEKDPHESNEFHQQSTTPSSSPPQPSVGSPHCSLYSQDEAAAHPGPSGARRSPPPLQEPSQFSRVKNLPLSPPILVPQQQRPHMPFSERLDQLVIEPAEDHSLFGTYHVAPDIFSPEEVQVGFPSSSYDTKSPFCRPHNDARFLDRNNTAWGKWYAKYPNPEDLTFAADYKGAAEATEQEVWDMHAAAHAKFRKAPPPPNSEEDLARMLDDEEHERAGRLRYHTGHCFDAILGYCYPFHDGGIV